MVYKCCGRSFKTYNSIRNHLDNSAAHENEIECRWCVERWPTHHGRLRLQHEKAEHWLECSADSACNYIFENQQARDDHIEEDHPPNYCYGCERRFLNANSLDQHMKSSTHVGKNVKCPWCPNKFTNLTGVCLHLESGSCSSNINREKIDAYCRQVDRDHIFTTKQIGWHDSNTSNIATGASWDGDWYRCCLCEKGFSQLRGLNQHLASPVHRQKIYHCPRCQREYVALSGLVNHLESESCGAFRFKANSAGLGFVQQLRLGT